jgi:mannose-6-phosphate isomerase-like protein (cupin superfamily)
VRGRRRHDSGVGDVVGSVIARDITVFGRADGQLIATEVIDLRPESVVTGDIIAPSLILHDGARFWGAWRPINLMRPSASHAFSKNSATRRPDERRARPHRRSHVQARSDAPHLGSDAQGRSDRLLSRRLIVGDRMMLAHVYLKKGCVVPRHQHENEQLTYVVNGALHFWIGEDESEEIVVGAGQVLYLAVLGLAQSQGARRHARRRHLQPAARRLARED